MFTWFVMMFGVVCDDVRWYLMSSKDTYSAYPSSPPHVTYNTSAPKQSKHGVYCEQRLDRPLRGEPLQVHPTVVIPIVGKCAQNIFAIRGNSGS